MDGADGVFYRHFPIGGEGRKVVLADQQRGGSAHLFNVQRASFLQTVESLGGRNNQAVVDEMITTSMLQLTSENTIGNAWDALFKSFNNMKGMGEVGYTAGQTIFIKLNQGTSSWLSNSNLERDYTGSHANYDPVYDTSPGVILAILRQLVNHAGVPQENIWVADPKSHVWQHTYNYVSVEFPDVKYGDKDSSQEGNMPDGRDGRYGNTRAEGRANSC